MSNIHHSVPKIDASEKISGRMAYVADIRIDGMLHAKTVRSTEAHARIRDIRVPTLPEGYYVIDHRDIPGKNVVKMIFEDWPVFAVDKVHHIGEPIMLVVGPDKRVVQTLVDAIEIDYEPLESVFSMTESVIHYHYDKGDAEAAFKEADRIIAHEYDTGYQEQAYIEPQGFIGTYEDDRIHLIGSIQAPYYVKNAVIETMACAPEDIRVVQATVGGAFGGKEEFPSLIGCQLAVALKKIKKPIKLIYEREEDMDTTTKRHPSKTRIEGAIKDGKITALRTHIGIDSGAFIGLSGVVLSRAIIASTSAYTVDNLDISGDVYKTNTVPNGAFRGFGAPQMIYAVEMFFHHVAKELGVDVHAFRLKHLAKQGDRTSTSGLFRDPILMPEMIERACAMSDYHRKRKAYADPNVYKGIGMSWFLHGCGFTGSGEAEHIKAKVTLEKLASGLVHLRVAAVDMGQGAKTTLMKVAAETLGLPLERIVYDNPDTDLVPDSGPTVASRTAMVVGGLIARAAARLKDEWNDGEHQTITEQYTQPEYMAWNQDTFTGDAYPAYSWGVNVVEVEVDKTTLEVQVKNIWSTYDVGKSLDDNIVIGQADGGTAQGVAYGYLEVMRHHRGKLLQKNMTDYVIPTAVDMAKTETELFDNPFAFGPYGAKGAGELTLVGGAPAVALAIEMAIGERVHSIPATPEYLMEVLKNAKR